MLSEFKESSCEKEDLYELQASVKKLKEKTTDGFNRVKEQISKGVPADGPAEIFPSKDAANMEDVEEMVNHTKLQLQKAIDKLEKDHSEKLDQLQKTIGVSESPFNTANK